MLGLLMRVAALAALAGPPGRPALEHTRYTLANGLEVILRPVHSVPLIAVHVRYHVGAADDPPGRRGLAHIVEHLSFEGTAHITGERAKLYRFYTGTVADNASTTLTSTDYYMTVPADYLATSLWIESDRMGFLGGMTTRSGLTAAQRVVANERRQRIDAEPYAELTERVYAALYPANHPYHGMLIGSMADIDAATVKDAEAFVAAWYTPANATLVLVGDLPRNTRALVDRYFGGLPAPAPASHAAVGQTPLAREVRLQASEAVGRSARVIAAWRSPARYTADDAVAEVLCDALTTGAGERLAMEQGGHAVFQVGFQQQAEPTVSTLIAQMSGRIGEPAVKVLAVMDHVLTRVGAGALTTAEIVNARERVITNNLTRLQSLAGQAARLQRYAHDRGAPDWLAHDLQRYHAVTPEAVTRFAREVLRRDRRVVLLAEPGAPTAGARTP